MAKNKNSMKDRIDALEQDLEALRYVVENLVAEAPLTTASKRKS